MTGTAATQAEEFRTLYGLDVEVIATNRPVIRVDLPDQSSRRRRRRSKQPLPKSFAPQDRTAGANRTASVEESERLSAAMGAVPHMF